MKDFRTIQWLAPLLAFFVSCREDSDSGDAPSDPSVSESLPMTLAFVSRASNLVPGDTNDLGDIYVRDGSGTLTRISVRPDGSEVTSYGAAQPVTSADGNTVAFASADGSLVLNDANHTTDVFVRDLKTGVTTLVSVSSPVGVAAGVQGDLASFSPSLSADGRYVAFTSAATNLVMGDTNGRLDVFVHDRGTYITTRVSVSSSGAQATGGHSAAASISSDGRYVAFQSSATNLVSGDTNGQHDVFVHDRLTGTTSLASIGSTGQLAEGGPSYGTGISADGRHVVFISEAANLVADDTNGLGDVFVRDRWMGTTRRVNISSSGHPAAGGSSMWPKISGDGRIVAFSSQATNLVEDDSNGREDVFVHDLEAHVTTRVSVSSSGAEAVGGDSVFPVLSPDGRYVAFQSDAFNLVPGDTLGLRDVYLHDRQSGTTNRVSVAPDGQEGNGPSAFLE